MKFSLHGWVEGLSGKQRFSKPNYQISSGQKLESSVNATQSYKASKGSAGHGSNSVMKPISESNENGTVGHYLDKCVVSQNNEDLDSSHLAAQNTVDTAKKILVNQEAFRKDIVLPKIKWGDLDEGTLIHYGKAPGAEFEFGGIKIQNLDPVEDSAQVEETTKEVNEVSLEDVKEQITCEKVVSQITSISHSDVDHERSMPEIEKTQSGDAACTSNIKEMDSSLSELGNPDVSAVPLTDAASSSKAATKDSDILTPENCEPGSSGKSILEASVIDSKDKKCKANPDDLLDAQNSDAVNLDATGESKERFRERLWSFLFENLNRAVDELYLLCELECDLGQMKEASLVLEEAASDFRELNARVENFEKPKRSSPRGADGVPLAMLSDHRRPHALSWEVSIFASLDANALSFRD